MPLTDASMNEYWLSALAFGLAAGLKPGPLAVIVIQQTLSHGTAAGIRAGFAPFITDGPIILAALALMSQFKQIDPLIAAIGLIGGGYLLWVSSKVYRTQPVTLSSATLPAASMATAVRVNLLNPNPYLFWFTVGGSYMLQGSLAQGIVFALIVLIVLVGTTAAIAWVAGRYLGALQSRAYLNTMKVLAVILAGFGALFILRSLSLLGLLSA